jgi:hypothetical protein
MAEGFPGHFGEYGKLSIVFVGGVLGIITMRFVVRYFIAMLDRFPGLAEGAYYLVAWIGLKLTVSGFHDGHYSPFHIPEWLFWSGMILIVILSFLISPKHRAEELEGSADLDLLGMETVVDSDTPKDDAPDGGNRGALGVPGLPDPPRDGADLPLNDHAIAAERYPDESR